MRHLFSTQHEWDRFVISKYNAKRNDARARGIEFTLTFRCMSNLLRAKKCAYTGVKLTLPSDVLPNTLTDLTIERVNPEEGYVPGNVIAVCRLANNMKSFTENAGLTSMKETHMILTKALKRINKKETK